MVKPHISNFRVITTNFLGVRIFRKFTVGDKLSVTHTVLLKWSLLVLLLILALFILEFYRPVNNQVMSSRSVNSGTVPGQA